MPIIYFHITIIDINSAWFVPHHWKIIPLSKLYLPCFFNFIGTFVYWWKCPSIMSIPFHVLLDEIRKIRFKCTWIGRKCNVWKISVLFIGPNPETYVIIHGRDQHKDRKGLPWDWNQNTEEYVELEKHTNKFRLSSWMQNKTFQVNKETAWLKLST